MDEKKENTSLDDRLDHVAQVAQAAYHVSAAVRAGSSAAGAAAGTAMAGPLGMLVGAYAGSKTIWKGICGIFSASASVAVSDRKYDRNRLQLSWICKCRFLMQTKPSQPACKYQKPGSNRFCKKKSMKRQSYR